MKIVMAPAEIELLTAFLKSCDHYFEFGMGGSTCLAAKTVGKSVTAIDSDTGWINQVQENLASSEVQVSLGHVDIGKTGDWGTPIGNESRDKFPAYSRSILKSNPDEIDLCLVDGRFRVACFLEALGHLRQDAIIGIHDYAARPHYHVVEEFARPICKQLQLAFFVRRAEADLQRIAKMAEEYRYDTK